MAAAVSFAMKQLNAWKAFGGMLYKYSHASAATASEMKLSVYLPPDASKDKPVPALYWLSGLTCNEDNFAHKAGAFRAAAQHNVAIICPDTSPRGVVDGEGKEGWDFGVGAGFYINASTPKWAKHYRMYDYVTNELPQFVRANFPVTDKQSIFGHSMGGHGALICHLKNPGLYASCSAFAPIAHPSVVPWGIKAFTGYLGDDNKAEWKQWDATELLLAKAAAAAGGAGAAASASAAASVAPILVDQGGADEFLAKGQLQPQDLTAAAKAAGVDVQVNVRDGYDHSYYFISTFVDAHIAHHAKYLHAAAAKPAAK